jgi:predicted rRNA methylase YqxC with S4 and FtsJ domains
VDKLIAKTGLVESVSEAVRKIRAGAVHVNGERVADLVYDAGDGDLIIQVGKNWRRVTR